VQVCTLLQTDKHASTSQLKFFYRPDALPAAQPTASKYNQQYKNTLHWLDVPQPVIFKLCMTVYKYLHGLAPKYLAELYVPVADVAGRRQLRSASRGLLNFPRYNMSYYGRRAFLFRRFLRLELTS